MRSQGGSQTEAEEDESTDNATEAGNEEPGSPWPG